MSSYKYVRKTWYDDNGIRHEVSGKTDVEAIEKMVRKQMELKNEIARVSGTMTVNEWFKEWKSLYKDDKGITAKSLAMYDEKYNNYIRPIIGKKRVKDIKPHQLQAILNAQKGMSYSHVSKLRSVMKQLFSRARKQHLIQYDPSEDLELPANERKVRRPCTEYERDLFLKVWRDIPGAIIFYTMLMTGMRDGELIALQWGDVDFKDKTITVRRAAESGAWHKMKEPKTAAGFRKFPLRRCVEDELLPLKAGKKKDDFVFVNQFGNQHSSTSIHRLWNSCRRAMDIHNGAKLYRNQIVESTLDPEFTPYTLRHRYATDLQHIGVPLNVIKTWLGHEDIQTTANIYIGHTNETDSKFIEIVNESDANENPMVGKMVGNDS